MFPWLFAVSSVFQSTIVFVFEVIFWVVLLYLAKVLASVGVPLVPDEPLLPLVPLLPEIPLDPEVPDVPLTGSTTNPRYVNTFAVVDDNANKIGLETCPLTDGSAGCHVPAVNVFKK